MLVRIRAPIETTPIRLLLHLRHFAVELPQVIRKGEHKILLQHFGILVFDVSIVNVVGKALILIEDVVA